MKRYIGFFIGWFLGLAMVELFMYATNASFDAIIFTTAFNLSILVILVAVKFSWDVWHKD